MNIKLYPCFNHLLKFNNIWLYSDPHFNDKDCLALRKNYIGDYEQIKRINRRVGKKDVIIFLGDIGDLSFVKKIRGYKILIMGNHDSGASNYKRIHYNDFLGGVRLSLDNGLFDEVYEGPVCLNEKLLLSHEPLPIKCMLNIHGHTHGMDKPADINHFCVVAEHIDYTPVSLLSLIKDGRLAGIESIHRQTIDAATERKKRRLGK